MPPPTIIISILTFKSTRCGIFYRPQLTFHHCLLSSVRYKMPIFQHQLGVVGFKFHVFIPVFHFIVLWEQLSVSPRAFLSSPCTVLLMCRLFLLANKNTYNNTNMLAESLFVGCSPMNSAVRILFFFVLNRIE